MDYSGAQILMAEHDPRPLSTAEPLTGLLIRPATPADLPAIRAIFNDAVLHTTASYEVQPATLEQRRAWFDARLEQGFPVLVAELEACVVAYGSLGSFRALPGYRYTVEHSVYVDAAYRGRGVGRCMLDRLIAAARELRMHAMIGLIDAENVASIHLHETAGFVPVARLREVGYKFGRWLDLVCMELLLAPSSPDGSMAP